MWGGWHGSHEPRQAKCHGRTKKSGREEADTAPNKAEKATYRFFAQDEEANSQLASVLIRDAEKGRRGRAPSAWPRVLWADVDGASVVAHDSIAFVCQAFAP